MSLKVAKHHCILHRYQSTEVAAIHQPPTPKTFQRPATKTREIQNGGFLCPLLTYVGHLESKERLRIQPAQLFNFS